MKIHFYNNFYLRGKKVYIKWNKCLKIYKEKYRDDYENLMRCLNGNLSLVNSLVFSLEFCYNLLGKF